MTVDARTGEVVELLQALIRNRCVNDGEVESGGESRNADALYSYLGSVGIDVERFHHPDTPHRASLVAAHRGDRSRRTHGRVHGAHRRRSGVGGELDA